MTRDTSITDSVLRAENNPLVLDAQNRLDTVEPTVTTNTANIATNTTNIATNTAAIWHNKGAWSSATAYVINDVVQLTGVLYICILGHTNHTPPNATYWAVLATGALTPTGSAAIGNTATYDGALNLLYDYPNGKQFFELRPTSVLAETVPRALTSSQANLTGGAIHMTAITLPINLTITSITFMTGTTGATNPTHQWFGIADSSRVIQQVTSDDTSTAWAASTLKTLNLASQFVTTYSGLHYLCICVTASTTVPGIVISAAMNGNLAAASPRLCGATDTAQTTPVTVPYSAIGFAGGSGINAYAYVK